jgi:ribosomal protein L7/L12
VAQVEGAPCVIKKMVGKAEAETIIAKLKEVGAEVAMV